MGTRRIILIATGALLVGSAGASAQACLGFPSRDGDIVAAVSFAPEDEIGGDFHADVTGPAAFGFAYRTDDDGAPSTWEARASYDFYLLEPAICVVGGVRYTDVDSPTVSERLGIPLGFGIGKTLDTGRLATTAYAIPQYMWLREVRTDALGDEEVETSNAFTGEAGLTLGVLPFFVNGAVLLDTADDDPVLRFRAGLIF